METKHIKDSKLYVCDFNNLQDYFAYLREQDKKISFVLREYFTSMMEPKNMLEQYFSKLDTKIVYTTDDAPIMVTNTDVYIHPIFYKEHELDFLKLAKDLILERIANEKFFLYIPDFALDSDIVKAMCSNKKCSYFIDNVLGNVLTEEIINQFQNEHLQVSDARGVISTNKAIGYYTFEALEKMLIFILNYQLMKKNLKTLNI